jgi:transposase
MYIDDYCSVINGKSYKRALIRESYREGKNVKKRTIANISHASDSQIEAIKIALKQADDISVLKSIKTGQFLTGKSVGAVAMLYQVAQDIGMTEALGKSKDAMAVLWMVFARLINQGSRLSAVRLARNHCVCEILGYGVFNENDLYHAMDWGCVNQKKIESKLFSALNRNKEKMKSSPPCESIFLYDVTSTYLEGSKNELAAYGYNRDKKLGKLQIVYGLLTDEEGIPLAIEAFKGNTKDNKTLLSQLEKIKDRFGIKYVTIVGDKGMIKSIEIKQIEEEDKFNYITSITKPQILKLLERKVMSMELFEEKLCEVLDEKEGLRYILRRNPRRKEEMEKTRESKLLKAQKKVEIANIYLTEHPKSKTETQLKNLTQYLVKLKLNEYVTVSEKSDTRCISIEIDEEKLKEICKLDGCYVIKTNLEKSKNLTKEIIHERYKALAEVEFAFRTQKTGYLEVRPVFVRKEKKTRAHLLITMLAYKIEKYLREKWKDINLTVEEGVNVLANISSVIIKVKNEELHRIPKPDKLSEKLLSALEVKLPGVLPLIRCEVDTRTTL